MVELLIALSLIGFELTGRKPRLAALVPETSAAYRIHATAYHCRCGAGQRRSRGCERQRRGPLHARVPAMSPRLRSRNGDGVRALLPMV